MAAESGGAAAWAKEKQTQDQWDLSQEQYRWAKRRGSTVQQKQEAWMDGWIPEPESDLNPGNESPKEQPQAKERELGDISETGLGILRMMVGRESGE